MVDITIFCNSRHISCIKYSTCRIKKKEKKVKKEDRKGENKKKQKKDQEKEDETKK